MSMKLFYVSTSIGCTIRRGRDAESVRKSARGQFGTSTQIKEVREATAKDIAWVRSTGGAVPRGTP